MYLLKETVVGDIHSEFRSLEENCFSLFPNYCGWRFPDFGNAIVIIEGNDTFKIGKYFVKAKIFFQKSNLKSAEIV